MLKLHEIVRFMYRVSTAISFTEQEHAMSNMGIVPNPFEGVNIYL